MLLCTDTDRWLVQSLPHICATSVEMFHAQLLTLQCTMKMHKNMFSLIESNDQATYCLLNVLYSYIGGGGGGGVGACRAFLK